MHPPGWWLTAWSDRGKAHTLLIQWTPVPGQTFQHRGSMYIAPDEANTPMAKIEQAPSRRVAGVLVMDTHQGANWRRGASEPKTKGVPCC